MSFAVDKKLVVQRNKDYQRKYHPDKFALKEGQLLFANEFSAYANEAKEVLLSDLKRMIYLVMCHATQLRLKGFKLEEHATHQGVPASFVSEIFELQEEIEETKSLSFLEKTAKSVGAAQS